mmetsp:Transcript_25648/g.43211  ORF Transcript_25648/g.43211 Transcript_25648/m.43211 type:complete len:287 (-) Transcript_25648:776-1636(-)
MCSGGKRPTALRHLTKILLPVHFVIGDLGAVQVAVDLLRALREALHQVTLYDGLHCERRIPALGAVVALHLHAVLGHPQVVVNAREMAEKQLVGIVTPASHVNTQHVQSLVHWPNVNKISLDVFRVNVCHHVLQRSLAHIHEEGDAGEEVFVVGEAVLEEAHHRVQRRVVVNISTRLAKVIPAHRVVVLQIELLAQVEQKRVVLHIWREAGGVQVPHREVDHACVAPHLAWVQGAPARQEPHLSGDRVDSIPVIEAQHRQPELAPGRGVQGTSMGVHEGSGTNKAG